MSAPLLQVIGDPVLHSKSPVLHGAMLAELGLDIPYTPRVVPKGGLPGYLAWAKAHNVIGFNATMPHKEDLVPLMDGLDGDAARIGAVNTVCVRDGRLIGHNTDGGGCLAALEEAGLWPQDQVVLLGAGGAAKAVALTLAAAGARRIWVCNRTLAKAQALADADPSHVLAPADFSPETLKRLCAQAGLVVNCTNLGMAGCGQFSDFSFLDALPTPRKPSCWPRPGPGGCGPATACPCCSTRRCWPWSISWTGRWIGTGWPGRRGRPWPEKAPEAGKTPSARKNPRPSAGEPGFKAVAKASQSSRPQARKR